LGRSPQRQEEEQELKKLMVLAAMLALLLLAAVPAIAQIGFGAGQGIGDTGSVSLSTSVTSSGDNSNQCVAPLQFGNTGNVQNAQGFLQYNSTADDIEFSGSSFAFTPSLTDTCTQQVQQAAAAGN
jgi:hypothetical protein